jgi:hypothetical protein
MAVTFAPSRAGTGKWRALPGLSLATAVALVAAVLGAAVTLFPPVLTAMVVAYALAVGVAIWRPEFALALVMMLAAGVIPGSSTARIPLAGGAIAASDIVLVTALALACLRDPRGLVRAVARSLRVAWPVYVLLAAAVLAALRSWAILELPVKGTLSELRTLGYWVLVPLVVAACRTPRARHRLAFLLVLTGVWLGAAITASSLTGIRFYEGGALGELRTVDELEGGVFRSQPTGMVFVIFAFLLIQAKWSLGQWRGWLPLAGLALAGLGILFNYGRGFWLATALAGGLVALLAGIRPALKAAALFTVLGAVSAFAIWQVRPDVVRAAVNRATTVTDEVTSGWSLRWRGVENQYARDALRGDPVLGIGLGAPYRPRLGLHESPDTTRYIHNSFYALWLKLGVLGPFAALAMTLAFLRGAIRVLRRTRPGADRTLVIASIGTFLVPSVAVALTQPEWLSAGSISLMATLVAFVVLVDGAPDAGKDRAAEPTTGPPDAPDALPPAAK